MSLLSNTLSASSAFNNNKYLLGISVIAFVFYCCINFIYFPIGLTFGDEERFIREATKLYEVGEFWNFNDRAWEMPLTAILYAFLYGLIGNEEGLIIGVRLVQSLLLIVQAWLIYAISMEIFSHRSSARMAFIGVLFYPFLVYYQALLLSETLFNTVLILSFYFVYRWYTTEFKINRYFILANACLVLSIYVKGTLSIFPPLLMALFYFFNHYNITRTLKLLIYSSIIYGLCMSIWWIRNYTIFDTFVPFTTSSGKVLYLGNNPHNLSGGIDMGIDVDVKLFTQMTSIPDELEKKRVFTHEALEFIRHNPERFMELMILKFKRFYNIVPNAPEFNQGYYRYISIISYGPVCLLFLISLIVHIRYFKRLVPIYMLFGYFTLIHMIFIASLRYRLPLEPFMILLSSHTLILLSRRAYVRTN